MSQRSYILYHGNCPDGFGAAWAAKKALGNRAVRYIPVHGHRLPPNLSPGSRLYLLDLCFPLPVMQSLVTEHEVTLIDHHETARACLPLVQARSFAIEKSACVLAWEWFHPNTPVPELLLYIQDRDLWNNALPQTREVFAALTSYGMRFSVWDTLEVDQLKREGSNIVRHIDQTVQSMLTQVYIREVGGYQVPVVNATSLWSDVGHALLDRYPEVPFVASYYDAKDGTRRWSLRSREPFNVGELAQSLGGGGHRLAAGFSETLP